jgi:DNA uptake protein ComE-like DNA-binding protein
MLMKKISITTVVAMLATGVAFAQPKTTPPSTTPSTNMPAAGAAMPQAKPAAPAASAMPTGTKVNLNTATADQLDSLPEIGKARTKLIMGERAKGNFKDWADFDKRMTHTAVNKGVRAKIKDHVTF